MRTERTTSDEKCGLLLRHPLRLGGPPEHALCAGTRRRDGDDRGTRVLRQDGTHSEGGFASLWWGAWATAWPTFTSDL